MRNGIVQCLCLSFRGGEITYNENKFNELPPSISQEYN